MREYNEMYQKYLKGYIIEKEWSDYCFKLLEKLMEDNKNVLIRLKNS